MAKRDDVDRVLAACDTCGSVKVAYQWPDGTIKLVGQKECSCGSADFTIVEDDSSSVTDIE